MVLYIDFVNREGECELELIDNESGVTSIYEFNSDAPACVYVGPLSSATLTITTAIGNIYTGRF